MSASQTQKDEYAASYDNIALAACVIGELGALFDAMYLMLTPSGNEERVRRLAGIGQNITDTWFTHFQGEAKKLEAELSKEDT